MAPVSAALPLGADISFAKLTRLGEFDFEADPDQVGEWASSTAHVRKPGPT